MSQALMFDEMLCQHGDSDECLIWPGARHNHGYGEVWYGGRKQRTHVLALSQTTARPDRAHALHSCDTPECFNPKHLRWGAHSENMHDWQHGNVKLTQQIADQIRAEYEAGGVSQRALAAKYGTSQSNVRDILRRKTWKG